MDEYLPLSLPTDEAVRAIVAAQACGTAARACGIERETEPGAPLLAPDEFVDRSFLADVERSGLVSTLYR